MTTRFTAVRHAATRPKRRKKRLFPFAREEAFFWPDPVVNQPFGCLAPECGYIALLPFFTRRLKSPRANNPRQTGNDKKEGGVVYD
ncbi:hypothetical protein GARCT_02955 [Geobacillus sp. 12AMOR1]|nr:hypothetical protein GARCT_02955 [Geobacillus sp. 12AMOR1]